MNAAERAERARDVVRRLTAGETLAAVGERYGVTRQAIRQIAVREGIDVTELRARQREGRAARRTNLKAAVNATLDANPAISISSLAAAHQLTEEETLEILGRRANGFRTREAPSQRVPDDVLLSKLKTWADQTSELTSDNYDRWAREQGIPGKQTVIIRFASWNEAMSRAGVHDLDQRGGRRPAISDAELWATVVKFLSQGGHTMSFDSMTRWCQERGLPSGALIRNRLGSWSQTREMALSIISYRDATRAEPWPFGDEVLAITPGEGPRRRWTQEDCTQALQTVAGQTSGPLTVALYNKIRTPQQPNGAVILHLFASWVTALVTADLEDRCSPRARARHRPDADIR